MCRSRTFGVMAFAAIVTAIPTVCLAAGGEVKTVHEGMVRANHEGVRAQASMIEAQAAMLNAVSSARQKFVEMQKTMQEIHTMAIDNDIKATTTFYDKRAARESYLANHVKEKPDAADASRYAKSAAPKRLSPGEVSSSYRGIRWPAVLQHEQFASVRERLDAEYTQKSFGNSGIGSPLYQQVKRMTDEMQVELRGMVREIDPTEYIAAKRFLDGLAYEARFPHMLDGVAAN